jgi:uncharacterized protein YcfL
MDKFHKHGAQVKIKMAGFLILIVLILAGCSSPTNPSTSSTGAIWATDISTSIGSSEKDTSQQVISYQITLKNREPAPITIHSITLLFPKEFDKRMLSDRKVSVENTVEPNASIKITGQLTFDASGVSKAQISSWGSPIKGIFATTEQSVFIQSQGPTK